MRNYFLLSISLFYTAVAFSQNQKIANKPPLDSVAIANWPSLISPGISPNGDYTNFTINRLPLKGRTLVLHEVRSFRERKFINADAVCFSSDNKQFVYHRADSLFFMTLPNELISVLGGIKSVTPLKGEWLVYRTKNNPEGLILRCLSNAKELHYEHVTEYSFSENNTSILLKTSIIDSGNFVNSLLLINLSNGKQKTIWSTSDRDVTVERLLFDKLGESLTFLVQDKRTGQTLNSIWYYNSGIDKAVEKVNDHTPGVADDRKVAFIQSFSVNGNKIFFWLQERLNKPIKDYLDVDIWNYKDGLLQAAQLNNPGPHLYQAMMEVNGSKVIPIEQNDDETMLSYSEEGNLAVVRDHSSNGTDKFWHIEELTKFWITSLTTGQRTVLPKGINGQVSLSPNGVWFVYFDQPHHQYRSYNTQTGQSYVIQGAFDQDAFAGWMKNSSRLFVYDNFDIWSLDPNGMQAAINLTGVIGRGKNLRFRLLNSKEEGWGDRDTMLLTSFSVTTKESGLYQMALGANISSSKLLLTPENLKVQVKASSTNSWLVQKESDSKAPNYYLTSDFIHYQALSDIEPQRDYNWLSTELIHYNQPNGLSGQALVYKPENFDPLKKYPVLFNYYEELTEKMYKWIRPDFAVGPINIPWFVSHGYIVVTPDIKYAYGQTGQSACDAVVGAASYMAQLPYINDKKMGINGHSFGGFETNYIVTHTSMFTAACSASGFANLPSLYSASLVGGNQSYLEDGQGRLRASLWEKQNIYIENSPVFNADKVTTPLLLMANPKDIFLYLQGIEFYTDLRRLDKKVWLLQYNNGAHVVSGKDAMDYTKRLDQFFDHYLKDAPAPVWMTKGVPANMKGVETGLELDPNGKP